MKRAQLPQPLIYVFVLVVAALILLFGYRMLGSVGESAEQARMEAFKAEFRADVAEVALQLNAIRRPTYDVPSSVKEVCFAAYTLRRDIPDISCRDLSSYPLIAQTINVSTANAFLVGVETEAFNAGVIETGRCDLRCFDVVNGKVSFRMTGTGESAIISRS